VGMDAHGGDLFAQVGEKAKTAFQSLSKGTGKEPA
jgi:hypothetical protein